MVVTAHGVGRVPLEIVVPITEWKPLLQKWPWFVRIPMTRGNGLVKDSAAEAFQVKSVSRDRFARQIGVVSSQELAMITAAVAMSIGYP